MRECPNSLICLYLGRILSYKKVKKRKRERKRRESRQKKRENWTGRGGGDWAKSKRVRSRRRRRPRPNVTWPNRHHPDPSLARLNRFSVDAHVQYGLLPPTFFFPEIVISRDISNTVYLYIHIYSNTRITQFCSNEPKKWSIFIFVWLINILSRHIWPTNAIRPPQ